MKIGTIAGRDISSIFRNRLIRVSVVAILIVPMLYSLCYLAAFWNPYGRLDQLPVAVLNLDEGAKLNDEEVNYGNQVVDDLKKNDEVKWSFVDEADLKDGLENTEYYSLFTIPADFSANIVHAKTGEPKVAQIVYTSNEAKNFLASQISGNVEVRLKDQVSASVTKEYTQAAFDGLYDAKDGLTQAADGAHQLTDGLDTLNGKVPALADGAGQLADGASSLKDGLVQLDANMPALQSGAGQLQTGLMQLSAQMPALQSGTEQLAGGAQQVSDGADRLASGGADLAAGTAQLTGGIQQLDDGLSALAGEMPSLSGGAASLQNGASDMLAATGGLKQGADGVSAILDGVSGELPSPATVDTSIKGVIQLIQQGDTTLAIALLNGVSTQYSGKYDELTQYLNQAQDITSQMQTGLSDLQYTLDPENQTTPDGKPTFAAGLGQLSSGASAADAAVQKLAKGAQELNSGFSQLSGQVPSLTDGINALQNGTAQVAVGAQQLNAKAPVLQSGAQQLSSGSTALRTGLGQAADGTAQLASGSAALSDGLDSLSGQVPALSDGVAQLYDGSQELSAKLADGVSYIDGNLVNSSASMAEYVSAPVELLSQPINPVPDYGTGFAPYFIPLSLWVGAILMFFIISPKADPRLEANSAQSVLGKYLSYAFVGILQAAMVGLAVLALGLRPNNVGMYFLTIIVMSLTAVAIVQALISLLGDAGRLIAIVLLILQLTADAGTFPLELVPGFFKVLNPFMPFTYCVTALRQAISGSNTVLIWQCLGVLAIFLGIFLVISTVFKKRAERLQDKLDQLRLPE